jgi:hypothetical protein
MACLVCGVLPRTPRRYRPGVTDSLVARSSSGEGAARGPTTEQVFGHAATVSNVCSPVKSNICLEKRENPATLVPAERKGFPWTAAA